MTKTLRDEIAIAAMQAMIMAECSHPEIELSPIEFIAKRSYEFSDAMLAEKAKADQITNEKDILSCPIEDLELTPRPIHCLRSERIFTIGDLIQKSESQLLGIRNLGRKSLTEIKYALKVNGLPPLKPSLGETLA